MTRHPLPLHRDNLRCHQAGVLLGWASEIAIRRALPTGVVLQDAAMLARMIAETLADTARQRVTTILVEAGEGIPIVPPLTARSSLVDQAVVRLVQAIVECRTQERARQQQAQIAALTQEARHE